MLWNQRWALTVLFGAYVRFQYFQQDLGLAVKRVKKKLSNVARVPEIHCLPRNARAREMKSVAKPWLCCEATEFIHA